MVQLQYHAEKVKRRADGRIRNQKEARSGEIDADDVRMTGNDGDVAQEWG